MQPSKKRSPDHFIEPDSLDVDITDLQSKFKNWRDADGRGKTSAWTLLGKAYELGSAIANDKQAKGVLVTKVSEVPEVQKSNKWDPSKQHTFNLLLVLLLGLKEETKVTKSQWLRTLKTAGKRKVPATQDAFVGWIKKTGGIAGVIKLGKKSGQSKKAIAELALELPEPEDDFMGISNKIPKSALKCQDHKFLEGFALILVRESDENGKIQPVAAVVNETQIRLAINSAIADNAKKTREVSRQMMQEARQISKEDQLVMSGLRKAAEREHRARKSKPVGKKFPLRFREFWEEYLSERGDMVPASYKRLHPHIFPTIINGKIS